MRHTLVNFPIIDVNDSALVWTRNAIAINIYRRSDVVTKYSPAFLPATINAAHRNRVIDRE